MMKKRGFLSTIPTLAHVIGLGSILIWAVKAVVLDHIHAPALFMADFGRVFEGALSAIFAGYVFYILFALWPEYRDRRVLSPYISKKIHFLVNDCISILKEIEHASGHGLPLGQVSRRQIEAACKATSTAKGPRTVIGQAGMPRRGWSISPISEEGHLRPSIPCTA